MMARNIREYYTAKEIAEEGLLLSKKGGEIKNYLVVLRMIREGKLPAKKKGVLIYIVSQKDLAAYNKNVRKFIKLLTS
jgi:hypothetical protein